VGRSLRSVPPMNRIILCVAFVIALLGVQGLSLHAHFPHDDHHEVTSHHDMHVHSHAIDHDIDDTHEHSDAVPIDLLTSALSRDHLTPSFDFTLQAVLILALVMVWTRIERMPPSIPIIYFSPPRFRTRSPRAPPR
jgi:hypothetical protein